MTGKILVADDDADNRMIMAVALRHFGYQVCEAKNGAEAIETASREAPDLILLDISMPEVSGLEAVRKIKALPQTRNTPVLAFTAHALAGDEQKAREAGYDGYISKPCIPQRVVDEIGRYLDSHKTDASGKEVHR